MDTQTGFAPVAGGQLYYEVSGVGHPLLLVHAGVADLRMWDDQVAYFAQHYRVIRYDERGFGRTTTENVSFSNRQDIFDLLAHLGVERTYIMGLSRGGVIALDFTIEHPEMVDALINVAGGISGFDAELLSEEMALEEQMEAAENRNDFAAAAQLVVRGWADGPFQPEGRASQAVRDKVYAMTLDNYQNHFQESTDPQPLQPPAISRLDAVAVPMLVIAGALDESIPTAAMRHLAQSVPAAKLEVFPDTAHMVNMEQPERFNAIVGAFL
ncbi:MAG TPA: alpha/beta fold hydrolase, partial [Ktedonobacterales bacterium]|nr:alpha/beta fold hydrolase [Ktedonobacterales bacterium]